MMGAEPRITIRIYPVVEASYNSRKASATSNHEALIAGSMPPANPIPTEKVKAFNMMSKFREKLNASSENV